jgi:hypothetical protein
MLKNWKITCNIVSPIYGELPKFDSLLQWEMSFRLGIKHEFKLQKQNKLSEIKTMPIPLSKKTIGDYDLYCCSDPIIFSDSISWSENHCKRLETEKITNLVKEKERKTLQIASGNYKMRFVKLDIKLINKIIWFVRGDIKEIRKLLKSIFFIGKYRKIGYGLVSDFKFEEIENDYSIFAENENGEKVLMKTIPYNENFFKNVIGYSKSFGSAFPPYWHPETFMNIAVPC